MSDQSKTPLQTALDHFEARKRGVSDTIPNSSRRSWKWQDGAVAAALITAQEHSILQIGVFKAHAGPHAGKYLIDVPAIPEEYQPEPFGIVMPMPWDAVLRMIDAAVAK